MKTSTGTVALDSNEGSRVKDIIWSLNNYPEDWKFSRYGKQIEKWGGREVLRVRVGAFLATASLGEEEVSLPFFARWTLNKEVKGEMDRRRQEAWEERGRKMDEDLKRVLSWGRGKR